MTRKDDRSERFSLARWSRRKLDVTPAAPAPASPAPVAASPAPAPAAAPGPSAPPELPPVESLHFDSDFTAFLRPEVDEKLKRAALKQLFRDPRFNVMDGLDTYIDDYTKADPVPNDVLADLLQRGFGGNADATQGPVAAPDPSRTLLPSHEEAPAAALPEGERAASALDAPLSHAQESPTVAGESDPRAASAQASTVAPGPPPKER